MIISVVNKKGGVGKTTTSVNLAYALNKKGIKTAVIDFNLIQNSAVHWASLGESLNFVFSEEAKFLKENLKKYADYNIIILDTAPDLQESSFSAILQSNFFIVPIMPGELEYDSTKEMLNFFEKKFPTTKIKTLVSALQKNTKLGKESVKKIKEFSDPFTTKITHRYCIKYAVFAGKAVGEFSPTSDSAKEYALLADEVTEL